MPGVGADSLHLNLDGHNASHRHFFVRFFVDDVRLPIASEKRDMVRQLLGVIPKACLNLPLKCCVELNPKCIATSVMFSAID